MALEATKSRLLLTPIASIQQQTKDKQRNRKVASHPIRDDPLNGNMKKIKVKGKDLEKLSSSDLQMADVELLDLSPERESCLHLHLPALPASIAKMVNLRILMLDTNELTELPEEICGLSNLERVSLSNNNLQDLPAGFGRLKRLTSLHLSNNEFSDFPKTLCGLMELQFLDLSDNQIVTVPNDISKLTKLHTLLLFLNRISVIPDTLGDMSQLRCLWLGNNNLTKLPRNFGNLKNLDWGLPGHHTVSAAVEGNPLTEPPIDVCTRGIRAIADYFSKMSPQNSPRKSSFAVPQSKGKPSVSTQRSRPNPNSRESYDRSPKY